jgi:serine protease SohB
VSLRRIANAVLLRRPAPRVAVLRLSGVIGGLGPWRSGMSLATLAPAIERAFALADGQAVALAINSPGGAPGQSALICERIRELAAEKKRPVIAFCEDVAASGGYWLACAGDEIFVNANSIVGSIGVISAGFGFEEAISRLGIERRVHTRGEKKARLDPFRPEAEEDVAWLGELQDQIHENFKALVRERRADKLVLPEDELFSGEVWVGARAVAAGLADGVGGLRGVMRERFGERVRLVQVEPDRSWLRRRLALGSAVSEPAAWADALLDGIEARALWRRYGL